MKKRILFAALVAAITLVPQDGRSGLLDPITDPLEPITDPLLDGGVGSLLDGGTGTGTIGTPGICLASICLPSVTLGPVELQILPSKPLGPTPPPPTAPPTPTGCTSSSVRMRVLVISADGTETVLPAIQQSLDYHAIPYVTWIASQRRGQLTSTELFGGCGAKYQGVILTTGALAYSPDGGTTWQSGLTGDEWIALRNFETNFGIREIAWYVFPGADQGLNPPSSSSDSGAAGINARLTEAGRQAFPYVNANNPIPIYYSYTYRTTPAEAGVTPLLVDDAGNALMSSRKDQHGRESLAMTFDSNAHLLHHVLLSHGLLEWLTRGTYMGEFRTYLSPQIDDLYLDNEMYVKTNYPPDGVYRIGPTDMTVAEAWQRGVQSAGNPHFRLAWAFNGLGWSATDPLSLSVRALSGSYHFISHTFTHTNMDAMDYDTATSEVGDNNTLARNEGFGGYSPLSIVTPQVSGLNNPSNLAALWDMGVRYTVSDTSRAGWDNPRPNIGIYSRHEPGLLHIPRRPTNLYYNVAMPAEWAAEYNAIYRTYWGRDLTYQEILDKESHFLLFYMLRGEIDPQMYHQPNMRAYDGVHSLLSDLHDMAIQKLRRHSKLPIVSPDMHVAGKRMADTMARNAANIIGRIQSGGQVTLTNNSTRSVDVALSGVCTSTAEKYFGKCISKVTAPAGQTVSVPLR
ncbi:MAG TPA: hypothetical protein VE618_02255 [Myxococcaceae bacterium]|nr:hypothetical protein [Myxococcaceae bacterium]